MDTLGDTKIPRPVVPVAYYPGEVGTLREGGKRSVPCSGAVLSHLEMREGRLRALLPGEQNFGEWMEFRHGRSWLSGKRKSNGEIKHGGGIKLGIKSSKLSD